MEILRQRNQMGKKMTLDRQRDYKINYKDWNIIT